MASKDSRVVRPTPAKNTKTTSSFSSDVLKEERPSPFSIEGIRSGAMRSNLVKGFIIVSGLIVGVGFMIGQLLPGGEPGAPTNEAIAVVGDESVSGVQLARAFEQQRQFYEAYGQKTGPDNYFATKQGVLKQLTDQATLIEAAEAQGIQVSDAEVDAKITELINEQLNAPAGGSGAAQRRRIEAQFGSLEKAREELRSQFDRELVRESLLVEKLEKGVKDANRVTEADFKAANTKLKLRQIVVRAETPTAASKDPAGDQKKFGLAAEKEAQKVASELGKTPTAQQFAAAAKKYSDDEATKTKGGEIGFKLPSEFAQFGEGWETKLANANGKLVGPLKDNIGSQYVFFIEDRKLEMPKDYAKNKTNLLKTFEEQRDDAAWREQQEKLTKGVQPQISDPALAAYQLTAGEDFLSKTPAEQKQLRQQSLERFNEAAANSNGLEEAAIHFERARLLRDLNQPKERLTALGAAVAAQSEVGPNASAEDKAQAALAVEPSLRLEYARALREADQKNQAVEQLQLISKTLDENPPAPSPFGGGDPSSALRQQISAEFSLLGKNDLAAAESQKIAAPAPGGMGGFPGGMPPNIQMVPGG